MGLVREPGERRVTLCVLSSTPNTIHVVRGPLARLDDGIITLCGRRGLPREVPWHVVRRCSKCREIEKEGQQ